MPLTMYISLGQGILSTSSTNLRLFTSIRNKDGKLLTKDQACILQQYSAWSQCWREAKLEHGQIKPLWKFFTCYGGMA